MIWYDMIWYDMIWYDMIWYDMIWYDMIWYDMIWYDMWYDISVKLQLGCHPVAVVQYTFTQTVHRTTQKKQYIEQQKYGRSYDHISLSSSHNDKCFSQKLYTKSKHVFYIP
jgi:hypothetical protein